MLRCTLLLTVWCAILVNAHLDLSTAILTDEKYDELASNIHMGELDRFSLLASLQVSNVHRYFDLILRHANALVPVIYTPGVGAACWVYGLLPQAPQGLIISLNDKGRVNEKLKEWEAAVGRPSVIVVTDGERILGLGDLGIWGMGIPVGKLNLYTALAGIHPSTTLPVAIDVGTNTERLINHPLYNGIKEPRNNGPDYDNLIEEFILSVKNNYPSALLQFEDFGKHNAFRLLEKYEHSLPTFNDDIQGTAAVTLAGLYNALPDGLLHKRFLFLGAGQAAVGISDLIVADLKQKYGLSDQQARLHCYLVDRSGVVHSGRPDLTAEKMKYAHTLSAAQQDWDTMDLLALVNAFKPHALIGVSGQPQKFTQAIIKAMAELNDQPIIFALSNPTSKSECTAEQAYRFSDGRAIFASGSPFPPFTIEDTMNVPKERVGKVIESGQANNCFIFPGIGLGAALSGATVITEAMMLRAARELAQFVPHEDVERGLLYPTLDKGRAVSAYIARGVIDEAVRANVSTIEILATGDALIDWINSKMYDPKAYLSGAKAATTGHIEL